MTSIATRSLRHLMLTLAALLSACAAVDADSAPPLRLEDYWSGLHDPWPHQPGKEFEPPSPARLVERRLNRLFPPGTAVVAIELFLEGSGLLCGPLPSGDGVAHCLYARLEPGAPQNLGVFWVIAVHQWSGTERLHKFHATSGVAPLSMFPPGLRPSDFPR